MSTPCPVCNRIDAIQKLTAIQALGKVETSGPGGLSESATKLILDIQPPYAPNYDGCTCLTVLALSAVVGGIVAIVNVIETGKDEPLIGLFVAIVIAVFFVRSAISSYIKTKRKRQQWQAKLPKAMEIWNRMYYCARDDIIFDPETGKYYPREQFRRLFWPWPED